MLKKLCCVSGRLRLLSKFVKSEGALQEAQGLICCCFIVVPFPIVHRGLLIADSCFFGSLSTSPFHPHPPGVCCLFWFCAFAPLLPWCMRCSLPSAHPFPACWWWLCKDQKQFYAFAREGYFQYYFSIAAILLPDCWMCYTVLGRWPEQDVLFQATFQWPLLGPNNQGNGILLHHPQLFGSGTFCSFWFHLSKFLSCGLGQAANRCSVSGGRVFGGLCVCRVLLQ